MDVDTAQAVLARPRTHAAADGLEIDPEAAVVGMAADEARVGAGAVARGRQTLGHRLGERAVNQVGQPLAGAIPAVDRGRDGRS